MVQVGNIHVGKAETAKPPALAITEAAIVWDLLSARYKCIEETSLYHSLAHDAEFKKLIARMGMTLLERQAEELEKQCSLYGIPMPKRPPLHVDQQAASVNYSDEYLFRQIFEGCQHFIERIGTCIKTAVYSEPLRGMFM